MVPVKATSAGKRAVKLQIMMVGRKSFRNELPEIFWTQEIHVVTN